MKQKLRQILRSFFTISTRERKRIILLLPLLVAMSLLFLWQGKPRFEQGFTMYSDEVMDSEAAGRSLQKPASHYTGNSASRSTVYGNSGVSGREPRTDSLFQFDPNRVSLNQLVQLGFSPKQAQGIINYRNAGKVFYTPDDFAKCYTVSPERFAKLRPYIRIESRAQYTKSLSGEENRSSAILREGNTAPETLRDEKASVQEILPVKDSPTRQVLYGGELSDSSASPSPALERTLRPRTELNGADSAALVALRGIGPLTASRIVSYRARLGGFHSMEQLTEIAGMTEGNYELILQQIFVDSSGIQKIDINFASPEKLKGHPYLPSRILNKILKYRQLKGGWSRTGDLIEQDILSKEEAEKLSPYLYFRAR